MYITQISTKAKAAHSLGNSIAIICDGTYISHQKSSNNTYERKSYLGKESHYANHSQFAQQMDSSSIFLDHSMQQVLFFSTMMWFFLEKISELYS